MSRIAGIRTLKEECLYLHDFRPIVEETGRRNYAIMDSTHDRLETEMVQMLLEVTSP